MGQTTGVRGQLVGGVALGVDVDPHLEPTDVIEGAGGHHEVLERTTGDRVHRRVQVAETQPVTERFDVHRRPHDAAGSGRQAQVVLDVLTAVAIVIPAPGDGVAHLPDEVDDGRRRGRLQPQRNDVDRGHRHCQRRTTQTVHHGEPEDDVTTSARPAQVDCDRRGEDVAPTGAGRTADRGQAPLLFGAEGEPHSA